MEKIPAACAMEWSIQLDKNLRSKEPGKNIEALEEIGSYLEWWNKESRPTVVAEYRFFGLIPGEEKLFLNSIFLRLAEAFRLGNKQTRNKVVKLFLRIRRKRDGEEGILRKDKLENYLELLRRVKEVFDHGDSEERVSALLMFGCCANIAKDCADIRYIVLSSLVSSDVLEVKASLFAAGSLCELSDDFGYVFLEMLTTMLKSPAIVRDVKLAGARKFCKIQCSFSLADKAYKDIYQLNCMYGLLYFIQWLEWAKGHRSLLLLLRCPANHADKQFYTYFFFLDGPNNFGACFKPYNDFTRLQILFSCPG